MVTFFKRCSTTILTFFSNSWWRKRKWLLPSTNACPSPGWIALSLQWKDDATKSDSVQVRSSVSCGISYNFCAIRFHIYFGCEFKRIRKNTILWTAGVQCSVKLAVKNKKQSEMENYIKKTKEKNVKKYIWCDPTWMMHYIGTKFLKSIPNSRFLFKSNFWQKIYDITPSPHITRFLLAQFSLGRIHISWVDYCSHTGTDTTNKNARKLGVRSKAKLNYEFVKKTRIKSHGLLCNFL